MLAFYRALIALRRRLAPLHNGRKDLTAVQFDAAADWLTIHRRDPGGAATFTAANFGAGEARLELPHEGGGWSLALATAPGAGPDHAHPGAQVSLPRDAALIFTRAVRS
jgi:maltooligosyltrehalose trehalohydrolase